MFLYTNNTLCAYDVLLCVVCVCLYISVSLSLSLPCHSAVKHSSMLEHSNNVLYYQEPCWFKDFSENFEGTLLWVCARVENMSSIVSAE